MKRYLSLVLLVIIIISMIGMTGCNGAVNNGNAASGSKAAVLFSAAVANARWYDDRDFQGLPGLSVEDRCVETLPGTVS